MSLNKHHFFSAIDTKHIQPQSVLTLAILFSSPAMKYLLFFLFSASVVAANTLDTTTLTVATQKGMLRGMIEKGVYVWKGVRYAQPPINALRFKLPQPLPEWQGVCNATEYGNIAHQPKTRLSSIGKMDEDCLFLNVWASAAKTVKKPVMFWIHGGGYALGAGSDELYNGSKLCAKGDVIVVTCNYRLGPLAFMYLNHFNNDSIKFDNNIGLHDQAAALQWVKDNIEAFGGDPNNITIFGESAGANSVLSQMASPVSKGLFQKAIVQSAAGFGFAEMSITQAKQMTHEYLKLLHINAENISSLFTISVDSLMKAGSLLFENILKTESAILTFAPVYGTEFLPLPATEAIKNGSASNIPLLIGTNKDEMNLFAKTKDPQLLKPNETTVVNFMRKLGRAEYLQSITPLYPKYPSSATILSMITDVIFELPANEIAASQSAFASTYYYRFDWSSFVIRLVKLGSCHGMELPFVFNSFHSSQGKLVLKASRNKKALQLSEKIQSAWINFARNGNPNGEDNFWPPYQQKTRNTMIFNNTPSLVSDPTEKIREGWQSLFSKKSSN